MNTKKSIFIIVTFILSMFSVQAQGPGGVTGGLKMWLRADDTSNLTLLPNTAVSNYNTSYSIAWQGLGTPSSTQTVVDRWQSSVGNTYYSSYNSLSASQGTANKPVYLDKHYLMNYHPAIDFYCNWVSGRNGISSFLVTGNAPMSAGRPVNSTTIVVMNAAVKNGYSGDSQNVYFMSWHQNAILTDYGQYRPGFGLRNNQGDGQPRFRVNSAIDIQSKAFSAGQTTIVDYQFTKVGLASNGATNNYIQAGELQAGYNMNYVYNGSRTTADSWYMNGNGSLGGSAYHDRSFKGMMSEVIMYERALSTLERNAVSSYFAIKYGITLRPNDVPSGRFNYVLSNGTTFWEGNTAAGTSQWVKFYRNIAAVIRDDVSDLKNNQAHSTDIGSIVHMGVAGTELYYDGNSTKLGALAYDEEVVAFGNDVDLGANAGKGILSASQECGDFSYIFNRRWLVNKITKGNRPIQMIVAAQNNLSNNLSYGATSAEVEMYNALSESNDVFLIIADSPDKLDPVSGSYGDFKEVIPMRFINGEHQCTYTFTENETYFTFGYKSNTRGCPSEIQFVGTKVLDWSQWTRSFSGRTFYDNINSVTEKSSATFDLGDGITAKQTIKYEDGVRANRNYPRYITNPKGNIEISRRGGVVGTTKVTTTIEYSTPVIPEFSISGLDARSRQYDEVIITGYCGTEAYAPLLSYAGNPQTASYKISGNRATVYKRGSQNALSKNGKVDVAFQGGVSKVVIDYVLKNRVTSSYQRIYISPVTIREVPPPPPVKDGLSFVKDVKESSISICEPVEYTFYITNTNAVHKYIKFQDILPAGMKWESLALDNINGGAAWENDVDISNYSIKINSFIKTNLLEIDSLYVPCTSNIKLKATASLDDNAVTQAEVSKQFANRATIFYNKVENDPATAAAMESLDQVTLNNNTVFTAIWTQRKDTAKASIAVNPLNYQANREVEVFLKVNNPNEPVNDMYLDIEWDAEFSYVAGSYSALANNSPASIGQVVTVDVDPDEMILMITGDNAGETGFTLPTGETVFKFILRAPDGANLQPEYDDNDVVVPNKFSDLNIAFLFISEVEDPCVLESMKELAGGITVPYKAINHIVTNKHITAKIKK